jgi:putative spermidine/putrescine transport system ATP-binding protein
MPPHEPRLLNDRKDFSSTSAAPEVKARFVNVAKSYDGTLVVRDLNLEILQGEFLTLLGASGSGKTTSLMMLAGFEAPTSGEIWLSGRRVERVPPHRRGMGVVFQNYSLFPHMTIAENIAYPLKTRRVERSKVTARVEAALEMVRLQGFGGRRPNQLSGGQQQRVALARALVFNPEIVLMDEPLGALDKNLRESMQFEISQLHSKLGTTIVYVTHDQSEALAMSTRIAVFDKGAIQQIGSPKDVYERPLTSFVASFLGTNNALPGSILEITGEIASVRLSNGAVVKARSVVKSGGPVAVSIRPERLNLHKTPPSSGALEGIVNHVTYLGDHGRAVVGVPNLVDVTVKVAHPDWLKVGDQVWLDWSSHDASALDPDMSA